MEQQKNATIKDISRRTGFSIATVSRVINGKGVYYGKETEEIIKRAVEELNYKPHGVARELKNRKCYSIGYIVPYIDEYYSQVFSGIQDCASENGYSVALLNSNFDNRLEDINMRNIEEQRYAGLIVATNLMKENTIIEMKKAAPVVSIGKVAESMKIPHVTTDNTEITKKAVNYLISLGHRRIAFLCGPLNIITEKERFSGYIEALQENSIKIDPNIIYESSIIPKSIFADGYQLIKNIMLEAPDITAFSISSDYIAVAAIKALSDIGLKVPEDISVIGFDNLSMTEYTIPTITTISQKKVELGYRCMRSLLDLIQGKAVENVVIPSELIIRESTKEARSIR